jgi:hypothetical protein
LCYRKQFDSCRERYFKIQLLLQVRFGQVFQKSKDIDQSDFAGEIERISNNYVMYSGWFKDEE